MENTSRWRREDGVSERKLSALPPTATCGIVTLLALGVARDGAKSGLSPCDPIFPKKLRPRSRALFGSNVSFKQIQKSLVGI